MLRKFNPFYVDPKTVTDPRLLTSHARAGGLFHPHTRVGTHQTTGVRARPTHVHTHARHGLADEVHATQRRLSHHLQGGGFNFGKFVLQNLAMLPVDILTGGLSAPIALGLTAANAIDSVKSADTSAPATVDAAAYQKYYGMRTNPVPTAGMRVNPT